MMPRRLRVVIFQEGDWLCGQCLEYDFATQAKSLEKLVAGLETMIVGHIAICRQNRLKPFAKVGRAPKKYWDMFRQSKITLPSHTFALARGRARLKLPPPEIRIAALAAA